MPTDPLSLCSCDFLPMVNRDAFSVRVLFA
jgi:hypothetical protein